MNAPLRVPTNTRTWLIGCSLFLELDFLHDQCGKLTSLAPMSFNSTLTL
jgi:hypothetical protein